MPAANNREELELELATERSTLRPAAACRPTGHPLRRAGARARVVCLGVASCGGRATGGGEEWWTIAAVPLRRTRGAEVDVEAEELSCAATEVPVSVDVVELWLEALGEGAGCGEPACEWGAASGLGPARADPAANAVANSAQQRRTRILPTSLPTALPLAFTTRAPLSSLGLGC